MSAFPKYRPDIDGLRAVAVLAVVGFHAFPELLKGGFIGVDIFFVISGYLISSIIFNQLTTDSFKLSDFYSRRIKRIFPALLLVLITCYAFGWFALFAHEYKQLGRHIFSGASFIANFILWTESGYFDNSAETKPLLHLWSLGIEEQFYIFWPLLIYLAWRLRINLWYLLITGFVISFLLNIGRVHRDIIGAFYAPQTRFWELLLGALLAYYHLKDSEHLNKSSLNTFCSLLGAGLIVLGIVCIIKEQEFPGWWALLPSVGAMLIISAGPNSWLNRSLLSNKVLVWIGLISFPLYLWHWPLLSFARIVEGEVPSYAFRVALVFISILFAWITYELIEKPIRHRGQKPVVFLLFSLMCLIASLGYYSYSHNGLSFRTANIKSQLINEQFVGPLWKFSQNDICLKRFPFREAKDYRWWFCMLTRDEKPDVLLLGNSRANQLYAGLVQNSDFAKKNVLSIGTCDPGVVDRAELKPADDTPCSGERPLNQEKFINEIITNNADSLDYVIFAGLDENVGSDNYINRLKQRIDFIENLNIKVVVFISHLIFDRDIESCFARPFQKVKTCDFSLNKRTQVLKDYQKLIQKISLSNPKVLFFDQNDLLCDERKCSMVRNGMPLFRDKIHFSEYGSIEISKIFAKWAHQKAPELLA